MLETLHVTSRLSFEETITQLTHQLMKAGFGTLATISLNERFEMKNLSYDDKITILEVCNPFEAHSSLKVDENVVYFLPCKLVIKQHHHVVSVSMFKPTAMISLLGHHQLDTFASTIEKALMDAMDDVK